MGASKRGWTTWMIGSVTYLNGVNVKSISPLVPIAPRIRELAHWMWKSYQGFSFAWFEITKLDVVKHIDDWYWVEGFNYLDPLNFRERLDQIPILAVYSTDDEFMMTDFTNLWYKD